MASNYPAGLDALSTGHVDNVNEPILAASMNDVSDAANKIETELGINPRGASADVATRLAGIDTNLGTNPAGVYADVASRLNTLETLGFNIQSGTSYTLALTDASKVVSMINVGAITLTVPTNAAVAFLVGTQILVRSAPTAGTVTIVGSVGVTVESRGSSFALAGGVAWATLVKVNTNTWDLFGDLA